MIPAVILFVLNERLQKGGLSIVAQWQSYSNQADVMHEAETRGFIGWGGRVWIWGHCSSYPVWGVRISVQECLKFNTEVRVFRLAWQFGDNSSITV